MLIMQTCILSNKCSTRRPRHDGGTISITADVLDGRFLRRLLHPKLTIDDSAPLFEARRIRPARKEPIQREPHREGRRIAVGVERMAGAAVATSSLP